MAKHRPLSEHMEMQRDVVDFARRISKEVPQDDGIRAAIFETDPDIDMREEGIVQYFLCRQCALELPEGQSMSEYVRYNVGWTKQGFQVWCMRHNSNVMHIDFEGFTHPGEINCRLPVGEAISNAVDDIIDSRKK